MPKKYLEIGKAYKASEFCIERFANINGVIRWRLYNSNEYDYSSILLKKDSVFICINYIKNYDTSNTIIILLFDNKFISVDNNHIKNIFEEVC